jgi:hypothetical protein
MFVWLTAETLRFSESGIKNPDSHSKHKNAKATAANRLNLPDMVSSYTAVKLGFSATDCLNKFQRFSTFLSFFFLACPAE